MGMFFFLEMSKKFINRAKFLKVAWLKVQNLHDFRKMLKRQKLERFLEMIGNIYL